MQRANPVLLAIVFLVLIGLLGGAPLFKGALYLAKHEGDTLHLVEMVLRMAEHGQWPHLDFMTPIGVLAMAPIAAFVSLGAALGHAMIYAQIAVALVLLLPVLRVASSRFEGNLALIYGGYVMVLCLALVHGEAQPSVSLSMHYNRWAWAIAYVAVPLVVLRDRGEPLPWLDGALIGLAMAALALIKVTYFVALAPAVLVGLLVRAEGRMLLSALLSGLAVVGLVTWMAGVAFWAAYLGDLVAVSRSSIRMVPGDSLIDIVVAPRNIAASFLLLAAVIFLRQAGRLSEGLILLLLVPGFFLVTWQNYGNDPQWLMLLALFAYGLRPDGYARNALGWPLRSALGVVGLMAIAFALPSVINTAYSPLRHVFASAENTVPLLPARAEHQDIFIQEPRFYRANAMQAMDGPEAPYAAYRDRADRSEVDVLNGESLPECELQTGYGAWFETVAQELVAAGYAGKAMLIADLFSPLWLYGDFPPLLGAAPWNYGRLDGIDAAEFVLVPLCPTTARVRTAMLKQLQEDGWNLIEVRRSETYILLRPVMP